jgi:cell wall-associated NlpC family hydrolase
MMIKKSFLIFCAVLFLPMTSLSEENNAGSIGIVSAPLANVHEAPLLKSELVTQVLMADEVRILEKRDNRYRISIPSQGNIEGWIQQEAVTVPKDKSRNYLDARRHRVVITVPKASALILDKTGDHKVPLYAGTRLPVLANTAGGYKVLFPDRSSAIISSSDAKPLNPSNPVLNDVAPQEIAKTARQFIGARYLDGGLTAQGIDTRGLIYIVYRVHGIPVEPARSALKSTAEKVQKKDLLPGDILLFYGEGQGLSLGDGRFLQVLKKQTVQVAGIYDRRYAHAFQYGLRIIGSDPEQKKRPAEMAADEVLLAQIRTAELPLGKRIVYWAARFIGTPYDPDPLGLYVRTNRIVADEKVDCMYHTFRSVELAQSQTPREAIEKALSLRFLTRGTLVDGIVQNYNERFQYGEDMVFSGKWGKNITADLGEIKKIVGSRGQNEVDILPKSALMNRALQTKLQDGDIMYWVKDPKKRVVEEIVAHLSIVRIKSGKPYLIHAAGDKDNGRKRGGGKVKEVPFADYVSNMRFIGAFVTRFEP